MLTPDMIESRLRVLLHRLRERCAETADNTLIVEFEGLWYYGEEAGNRIRDIELDVAVKEFMEDLYD